MLPTLSPRAASTVARRAPLSDSAKHCRLFSAFLRDETGFIVSAELVLVATIVVIGLVVGLSEVQHAVVQELNDVGDAIGSVNQGYFYGGLSAWKTFGGGGGGWGVKSRTNGSFFIDSFDQCDWNQCQLACDGPISEQPKFYGGYGYGGSCSW